MSSRDPAHWRGGRSPAGCVLLAIPVMRGAGLRAEQFGQRDLRLLLTGDEPRDLSKGCVAPIGCATDRLIVQSAKMLERRLIFLRHGEFRNLGVGRQALLVVARRNALDRSVHLRDRRVSLHLSGDNTRHVGAHCAVLLGGGGDEMFG